MSSELSLLSQIAELKERVAALEAELASFRTHATLARGIAGEQLIVRLTGGSATLHTAAADIVLQNGETVEVKSSKITPASYKWQWNKIFGQAGRKVDDHLILIGDADPQRTASYAYPGKQVVFLVPRAEVERLCGGWHHGVAKISLTPNPRAVRGPAGELYRYQIDPAALERCLSHNASGDASA